MKAISAPISLCSSLCFHCLNGQQVLKTNQDKSEGGIGGGEESRQSLFATVVGGVKEKKSR
jgi:hypothetical protein